MFFFEVKRAVDAGLIIVPVRLDHATVYPELNYLLTLCHWVDASDESLGRHVPQLIEWLRPGPAFETSRMVPQDGPASRDLILDEPERDDSEEGDIIFALDDEDEGDEDDSEATGLGMDTEFLENIDLDDSALDTSMFDTESSSGDGESPEDQIDLLECGL